MSQTTLVQLRQEHSALFVCAFAFFIVLSLGLRSGLSLTEAIKIFARYVARDINAVKA